MTRRRSRATGPPLLLAATVLAACVTAPDPAHRTEARRQVAFLLNE